ncbi:MAG: hypothetical protein IJC99_02955 [Clostridia bacterium]|nr:hypothetical protein [Clostridia bacterium]
MLSKEDAHLVAHARELLTRAARGSVTYTAFLTPREQLLLTRELGFARESCHLVGGYANAERRRMAFLPDYLAELAPDAREAVLAEELAPALVPLRIQGSGYRELTHRDYLGAVLSLGIDRDAIGDILLLDAHSAVLLTDEVMATFLAENLTRAAQDAVRVTRTELPDDFDGGRRFAQVTDTVASPRADAVVAALLSLSRERAQALFAEGRVEVDYEPFFHYDRELAAGATVSVRGYGKFILRSVSERTKKGRCRLVADRYV